MVVAGDIFIHKNGGNEGGFYNDGDRCSTDCRDLVERRRAFAVEFLYNFSGGGWFIFTHRGNSTDIAGSGFYVAFLLATDATTALQGENLIQPKLVLLPLLKRRCVFTAYLTL